MLSLTASSYSDSDSDSDSNAAPEIEEEQEDDEKRQQQEKGGKAQIVKPGAKKGRKVVVEEFVEGKAARTFFMQSIKGYRQSTWLTDYYQLEEEEVVDAAASVRRLAAAAAAAAAATETATEGCQLAERYPHGKARPSASDIDQDDDDDDSAAAPAAVAVGLPAAMSGVPQAWQGRLLNLLRRFICPTISATSAVDHQDDRPSRTTAARSSGGSVEVEDVVAALFLCGGHAGHAAVLLQRGVEATVVRERAATAAAHHQTWHMSPRMMTPSPLGRRHW